MDSGSGKLELALEHHRKGELHQAEMLYRQILAEEPASVDALHLLGVIAHQVGRNDVAVSYVSQAIRMRPEFPEALNNLGMAYAAMGKGAEAAGCYQQALRQRPGFAEAHNNLGNVLRERGQLGEAAACYRQALALMPDYATARNNLEAVLKSGPTGRLRLAVAGCGWFARLAHLPALNQLAAEGAVEIVALCSRSEDSLGRAERVIGRRVRKFTELDALLADGEIDIVDLVLPTPLMPAAIRSALRSGKHVISEKPCAGTVAECHRLLAEYAAADGKLWAVAENWRFKRMVHVIADAVRSGMLGVLKQADFHFATLGWQGDQGWRGSTAYDGGYLVDSGVHFAALLRRVVGEFEEVSAVVPRRGAAGIAEGVSAEIAFQGGVAGRFSVSFGEHEKTPHQLCLKGTDGTLHADFCRGRIEVKARGGDGSLNAADDGWEQGGVYGTLRHCIESIHAGTPAQCSPWEATKDLAAIEAMLESDRRKQPVRPVALVKQLNGCGRSIASFGGVRVFRPRHEVECSSVADVCAAVAEAAAAGLHVRGMGTGYSWPAHLATDGVSIRIGGMKQILEIDRERKTIRVGAGAILADITRALAGHGLCLPSLPFISTASIGGIVATGTHGTSPKWGTVADSVRSMKLVLASGEVMTLGPEPSDDLLAARVAVGMLGIIVEVELEAVEMPWVRHVRIDATLADFLAQHAAILAEYEHVWVRWILGEDRLRIDCMEASAAKKPDFAPYVLRDNAMWEQARHSEPAGVTARPGDVFMSMQYGVPLTSLKTAMGRFKSCEFAALHPGREIEMKFLRGSSRSYLGPNAGDDMVLFNLWWPVERDRAFRIFEPFEQEMRDLDARPHWGKLHAGPNREYLRRAYPGWEKFESVRERLDPNGVFSIFGIGPRFRADFFADRWARLGQMVHGWTL